MRPGDDVVRRLERAGAAELEELLREGEDPGLEAAARARLRRIMDADSRRPRSRRALGVAAAAAALLLAWLGLHLARGSDEVRPSPLLGEARLELEAPLGRVAAYGTFRWSAPALPPGAAWHVRVRAEGAAPGSAPLLEAVVEEPHWTPPDGNALPSALRWEVEGVGANGEPLGWAEQHASLSSH